MRNSYWLVISLLVLECVVLLIQPAECFLSFIPVSVHTALQILTLIVKIKSIIFKILLGLKLMGVEGFIMKRRRRSVVDTGKSEEVSDDTHSKSYLDWKLGSLPESQRTELLMAWERLEKLLGDKVRFQEDVCIEAMNKYGVRPVALWAEGDYLNPDNKAASGSTSSTSSNDISGSAGEHGLEVVSKWNASYWISTVLGSALGSSYACHILEKQLNANHNEASIANLSTSTMPLTTQDNEYAKSDIDHVPLTPPPSTNISSNNNNNNNYVASSVKSGSFS